MSKTTKWVLVESDETPSGWALNEWDGEPILGQVISLQLAKTASDLLEALNGLLELHLDSVFICGKDDEKQVKSRLHIARAAITKAGEK